MAEDLALSMMEAGQMASVAQRDAEALRDLAIRAMFGSITSERLSELVPIFKYIERSLVSRHMDGVESVMGRYPLDPSFRSNLWQWVCEACRILRNDANPKFNTVLSSLSHTPEEAQTKIAAQAFFGALCVMTAAFLPLVPTQLNPTQITLAIEAPHGAVELPFLWKDTCSQAFRDLAREAHDAPALAENSTSSIHPRRVDLSVIKSFGDVKIHLTGEIHRHLVLEKDTLTLWVYRFPSLCLEGLSGKQDRPRLDHFIADTFTDGVSQPSGYQHREGSIFKEILFTYRLIFAQSSKAREELEDAVKEEEGGNIDPLLLQIAAPNKSRWRPWVRPFNQELFNKYPRLDFDQLLWNRQEYSVTRNFPYTGSRLLEIEEFVMSRNKRGLKDLLWDPRDPDTSLHTKWTYIGVWCAIAVAVITLIIAVIEFAG